MVEEKSQRSFFQYDHFWINGFEEIPFSILVGLLRSCTLFESLVLVVSGDEYSYRRLDVSSLRQLQSELRRFAPHAYLQLWVCQRLHWSIVAVKWQSYGSPSLSYQSVPIWGGAPLIRQTLICLSFAQINESFRDVAGAVFAYLVARVTLWLIACSHLSPMHATFGIWCGP